ncbi:thiol:disulfide interchange protein DsbA/DsbL [Variovorax sp. VNK109]|uniref:thiol:disulfide interchange protein DsbA/DsbL n=1 Tax=Variovorax sp. VNK109 TaxID=3400919 RepID=UPI003C0012DC
MKRRDFSLAAASTMAAATLATPAVHAQPQRGTEYRPLEKAAPVEAPPGKVEVIEFFWYSCPHCNAFEPMLEAWIQRQPADVHIRRVPVAFRDDFVPQQKLFYTLEAMGKLPELHKKVFMAIHAEKKQLTRQEGIVAWAESQGLDKARFLELFNSFTVVSKAARGTQLQNAFKVQGVPSMGVAGRFYTDGTMAGNMGNALQVVDYLVGEVRKGR